MASGRTLLISLGGPGEWDEKMELGHKSMDEMRWEEIWDTALRIRAKFLAQPLSGLLREAVAEGLRGFDACASLAVRSSAVGEDSAGRSFAGLHESIIGVRGRQTVEEGTCRWSEFRDSLIDED